MAKYELQHVCGHKVNYHYTDPTSEIEIKLLHLRETVCPACDDKGPVRCNQIDRTGLLSIVGTQNEKDVI